MRRRDALWTMVATLALVCAGMVGPPARVHAVTAPTWTTIGTIPVPIGSNITSAAFVDALHGWAVDDSGGLYSTSDGGTTWGRQAAGVTDNFRQIVFAGAQDGYIAGNHSLVATHDGGHSWQPVTSATLPTSITAIAAPTTSTLALLAQPGGSASGVYLSTDGGASWSQSLSNVTLATIAFASATQGSAAGGNAIYSTSNGGQTWTSVTNDASCQGACNYQAVTFAGAGNGFMTGNGLSTNTNGLFFETSTDGGASWVVSQTTPLQAMDNPATISALAFLTPQQGVIAVSDETADSDSGTSEVRLTADGGLTWVYPHTPLYGCDPCTDEFVTAGFRGPIPYAVTNDGKFITDTSIPVPPTATPTPVPPTSTSPAPPAPTHPATAPTTPPGATSVPGTPSAPGATPTPTAHSGTHPATPTPRPGGGATPVPTHATGGSGNGGGNGGSHGGHGPHRLSVTLRLPRGPLHAGQTATATVRTASGARITVSLSNAHGKALHRVTVHLYAGKQGQWTVRLTLDPQMVPGRERISVTARLGKQHATTTATFAVLPPLTLALHDGAHLFNAAAVARIKKAATQAHLRIVLVTSNQRFANHAAWLTWLHAQARDPGAVTIVLHLVHGARALDVVPGTLTHLSPRQAARGVHDVLAQIKAHPTAGVVQLIGEYHKLGARSSK